MGKKVGKYEIQHKIATGRFGVVYKGCDTSVTPTQTGISVAIKSIPHHGVSPNVMHLFRTDIQSLQRINSPFLLRIFDVFKTARVAGELLEALAALQANGVYSRDIDLSNLLLTDTTLENSHIKLANFSLFRMIYSNSVSYTVTGNPLYLAPEVFNGEEWGWKADTWSLGVVTYEVVTAVGAFQCDSVADLKREMRERVVFPEECGVSREAKEAIFSMMRYSQDVRPTLASLRTLPFFAQSSPSLPPSLSPLLDFELIEVDESYPDLALQYLDIPSIDENSPLSASLVGEDAFSLFMKTVLELDSELQQSEDWSKLTENYERKKQYGIAAAACDEYLQVVARVRREIEAISGKSERPHPLVAHLLERVFVLTAKAQDRLSTLKDLMITGSLTDANSMLILESVTQSADDTAVILEVQRLLRSSREEGSQARRLKEVKDGVRLAGLLDCGSAEAKRVMVEMREAYAAALRE